MGVVRIAARMTGDFSIEAERAIRACADALGSVIARAGVEKAIGEFKDELRTSQSKVLAGQREILDAIGRSPHAFVMLFSTIGIAICAASLVLYYLLEVETIKPSFSWFGCFAFATYWLMGKAAEMRHRRSEEKDSNATDR